MWLVVWMLYSSGGGEVMAAVVVCWCWCVSEPGSTSCVTQRGPWLSSAVLPHPAASALPPLLPPQPLRHLHPFFCTPSTLLYSYGTLNLWIHIFFFRVTMLELSLLGCDEVGLVGGGWVVCFEGERVVGWGCGCMCVCVCVLVPHPACLDRHTWLV